MIKMIKNNYRVLLALSLMLCFFSSAYAQTDKLTLMWGDESGFTNVDDLGNVTNWSINTDTRQIQVVASFANTGVTGDRVIIVRIPRGFKIQSYSAKTGTVPPAGVSAIDVGSEVDAKLNSSVLTALDGLPFVNQSISGYTGVGTSSETPYHNMDGMVTYNCSSQCDNISLTLALTIDQMILPYNATSTVLPEIKVSMSNSTSSPAFNKEVGVTVTAIDLLLASLLSPSPGVLNSGSSGRQIPGIVNPSDPSGNTGTVPTFITGFGYGAQYISRHYAETDTFKTTYPLGVQYQGFDIGGISNDWWRDLSNTTAFSDGLGGTKVYASGHLTVSVDLINRIVTYALKNTCNSYTGGINPLIRSYWTATVDGTNIKWTTNGADNRVDFVTSMIETGGALINNPQRRVAPTNAVYLYMAKPQVKITLLPQNRTIRDLNAYAKDKIEADFPYNQMLGSFAVNNEGPTQPENITYTFEFPNSPQVQGVSIVAAQTSDNTISVTGKTNTNRTITYSGAPVRAANCLQLTPQLLGLTSDEFLTQLAVTQNTLSVTTYNATTTYNAINYFGKWVDGQEGDVKLTITDANGILDSKTDHTTIGWYNVASGTLTTTVQTPAGNALNTFYPGQAINFTSTYGAGAVTTYGGNAWDVVDPDIYINLPTGIDLDVNLVSAQSASGNYRSARFPLSLVGTTPIIISGTNWTSYHFKVANPLDIVALSQNQGGTVSNQSFNVTYTANISSACNAYPVLAPSQIYQVDLGRTAVRGLSTTTLYAVADASNLAGNGTAYMLAGGVDSPNLSVVKKPGLQVYLGIRTFGSTDNYFTYNGTEATIAPVSPEGAAQISISYENTSDAQYYEGSEIYLPVPKNGIGYTHYFNNSSFSDPAGLEDSQIANRAPQWTAQLTGTADINLPGFNTWYSTDVSQVTNYQTTGINASWKPVTMNWVNYTDLIASGKSLADVTMLKFVASSYIPSAGNANSSGGTTFNVVLASDAQIGKYNYWRSYQKGWLDDQGAGTWVYGSVIAATPAADGMRGMIFMDSNRNGVLDPGEEYNTSPNPPMPAGFTATLSGPGITGLLTMTINPDGSFESLNPDGSTHYLGAGTYTVTITNTNPSLYHFTLVYPDTRSYFDASDTPVWMNDVENDNIRTDNTSVTYTFTVDTSSSATPLFGIGLKTAPKFVPVNPQARKGL